MVVQAKSLKNNSFIEIQKLFDKAMTRVNMFVDMDTELVKESSKKAEEEMAQESSSKRAGEELEQEVAEVYSVWDSQVVSEPVRNSENDKSKKMQKYILKQQFEGFSVSNSEGLHKDMTELVPKSLSCPQLDHEDLEQLDEYDLEEMDLKWQKDDSKALVTIDEEGVDWTSHSEEDECYALMACNSSESDTESGLLLLSLRSYESDSEDNAVGGEWDTVVKPFSRLLIGAKRHNWHNIALQNKGIVDQWMFQAHGRNKAYLADIKTTLKVAPRCVGGSKGYITRKGGVAQETKNLLIQAGAAKASSTNIVNTVSTPAKASSTNIVNTVSTPVSTASPYDGLSLSDPTNPEQDDSEIPALEDIYQNPTDGIFTNSSYDDEGVVADFTNLETVVNVSPIPTSRINSFHPSALILGDPNSAVQTRSKVNKSSRAHAFVSYVQKQRRNNHKDFQHCLFACFFVSKLNPKKISEALEDESWVDAMQEELLQFKIQKVLASLGLAFMGKKALEQNGGGMDVKSTFMYGKIDEEVYVSQPLGFIDPKYLKKVYKVVKALYGLHQDPRAWYATLSTFLLKNGYRRGTIDKTLFIKKDKNDIMLVQVYVDDIIFGSTKRSWCDEFEALMKSRFQMSSMGELTFFLGLQVKQKEDGIFISQDKYVAEILKKFDFASVKTASTPIETQKPLVKDEEASDVDVHLYRSMIGSLMYLTASRPDIMFAVCACSRFQVTPKTSHLSAVKRIFRYLKSKPKLGLWYPRVSSFDLEAYSDSDYAGVNLDKKSTTGEAEYVAAANCCGQVLWIQNQMLDYGFNFMNTKIYIDNESTICIVKNPVFHSKTKHIAIRHHFIRDAYEKKLIQVLTIHTDDNVADLLTKAFDVSRFQFLVDTIGMINP
ncbi:putative ribonuclease H-like domain-containing protein [Tanacetum coccineum]